MHEIKKRYSNGEITVLWQPALCTHSTNCFAGLPLVFDPRARPWVKIDAADTATIVAQVAKCPSGALSIERSAAPADASDNIGAGDERDVVRIQASPNGPLLVKGPVVVIDPAGNETRHEEKVALCRCGHSSRKPFCDGTHKKIEFQG